MWATPTTKGLVLLMAIDAGMIPQKRIRGFDISAFERFWEQLSPLLKECENCGQNLGYVVKNECDNSTN